MEGCKQDGPFIMTELFLIYTALLLQNGDKSKICSLHYRLSSLSTCYTSARRKKLFFKMFHKFTLFFFGAQAASLAAALSSLSMSMQTNIRIGTRPSPLARIQAKSVAKTLQQKTKYNDNLNVQVIDCLTAGDKTSPKATIHNSPLAVKSIDFTGTLDRALLSNEIDIAVHSLKDIPPSSRWCDGLEIACCLPREDPKDVLVRLNDNEQSCTSTHFRISDLPLGTSVGTSSARRQAQLLALRDDLELVNLRGNIGARLESLKSGEVDALILAAAGLKRLLTIENPEERNDGNSLRICDEFEWCSIPPEDMLSGACQGIVAVICRSTDTATIDRLRDINDFDASIAAAAERSFLDAVDSFRPSIYREGGESSLSWKGRPPLASLMMKSEDDECNSTQITDKKMVGDPQKEQKWTFRGLLARSDGSRVLTSLQTAPSGITLQDAKKIGNACAERLLKRAGPNFYC